MFKWNNHPRTLRRLIYPSLFHNFSHFLVIFTPVSIVQLSSCRVRWRGGVGVAQEWLDWRQDSCNVVNRRPLVLKNIEAYLSIVIDIGVEHDCDELDGGGLVGVVFVKLEEKLKYTSLPRRVVRSKYYSLPRLYRRRVWLNHCSIWGKMYASAYHNVGVQRSGLDAWRRILLELLEVSH